MGRGFIFFVFFFVFLSCINRVGAQTLDPKEKIASASDNLVAMPISDRAVIFNVSDSGEYKPVTWGLDLAWLSDANLRRGIAYMGKDRVDIIRSSFMPTNSLVGDTALQGEALTNTKKRLSLINTWLDVNTQVALNSDHPSVNSYFYGNAVNWAQLINVTTKMHQQTGRTVVTVSPFNEPDYSVTGQGTIQDFYNIILKLKKNPRFDNIRISGGNTLNNDLALYWYNFLNSAGLDEGNTHQLAGGFDTYASFFQVVRASGDHASNDELHNVMDAMVGVEYGMQTGIWWGTAELARGEFVKASDGKRLGYAEHRDNWTAASVYRNPEGNVQAFGGVSERQSVTTTYRFISKDRDVYYDGNGPMREYTMELPGGAPGTYQTPGHTNAERVVNITWGEDIQPVIDGKYILVNRNSGKVMEVANGSSTDGANVSQATNTGAAWQQWNVTPIVSRIGGDFSYYTITSVNSGKALDVYNWSLDNNGNIAIWSDTKGANQQWYLEYLEDGWFYIRSRYSTLCLDVLNASKASGSNIVQWGKKGGASQQWRFLPVGKPVEFDAPAPPENLVATVNAESVRLDWSANPENDLSGYTVFRSGSAGGPYNTIARNVKSTAFVDNTCTETGQYFYKIKAVDNSLNSSVYSTEVSAITTNDHDLVAHYHFDGNTLDSSINLNHGATLGGIAYAEGEPGSRSIALNGTDAFIQLPATIANQEEITIAISVYWNGGTPWQRIFDFGNNDTEYMNLTPRLRFTIKNGSIEQRLNANPLPTGKWSNVTVTLGASVARMYVNGELVAESENVTIRPIDFKPVLNYIGRGQGSVPFFNGNLDDFRIYNYELSAEDVYDLSKNLPTDVVVNKLNRNADLLLWPVPVKDILHVNYSAQKNNDQSILNVININGKIVKIATIQKDKVADLDISGLVNGVYGLRLTNPEVLLMKKFVIQH